MTELYPLLDGSGRLRGVIGTGGDATKVCSLEGGCRYYLWMTVAEAWDVTGMLDRRGALRLKGEGGLGFAPVASWVLSPPYVHARAVGDLDEYARWLARLVGRELRGRRVLLGFSGGKDSVAALLTLLKLQEYVSFRLHVVYIHIPFLEAPRNIEFVERVASKTGVEIEILSAPRRDMKTLLKWKGMPRRGYRYCTVYKAKPMRRMRKEDPRLVEVIGDRLTESPKRFERLSKAAAARVVLAGRKFRPTYLFTLLDVVSIVRRSGLIHPDYLEGLPRVACSLCPYKALYEFYTLPALEDEALIEKVLEKMWRKWYQWTSLEVFREQRLWRFSALAAKPLLYAKQLLAARGQQPSGGLQAWSVVEAYRRVWTGPEPRAPVAEEPWAIGEAAARAYRRGLPLALLEEDSLAATPGP
ncbi:MAG: phosphoadenosine phosphosulfate reductase family protein [Crenarchaeota archaeon]|nr:phosphoadenosine phosphosulfate reductase family protein [Thermoproteota archaeon]